MGNMSFTIKLYNWFLLLVLFFLDECYLHWFLRNKINGSLFKWDMWALSTYTWIWKHFVICCTNTYSDFIFFEIWFLVLKMPQYLATAFLVLRWMIPLTLIFALTFLFVVKSQFPLISSGKTVRAIWVIYFPYILNVNFNQEVILWPGAIDD